MAYNTSRRDQTTPYIDRCCLGVDNPVLMGKTKGLETQWRWQFPDYDWDSVGFAGNSIKPLSVVNRFSLKLDGPTTLIDLFNIANRLGLDFGNSVFTLA